LLTGLVDHRVVDRAELRRIAERIDAHEESAPPSKPKRRTP
jgi:hypothetical protein